MKKILILLLALTFSAPALSDPIAVTIDGFSFTDPDGLVTIEASDATVSILDGESGTISQEIIFSGALYNMFFDRFDPDPIFGVPFPGSEHIFGAAIPSRLMSVNGVETIITGSVEVFTELIDFGSLSQLWTFEQQFDFSGFESSGFQLVSSSGIVGSENFMLSPGEQASFSIILGFTIAAVPPDDPPVSVPEPGTLALFGIGLLGIGLARRKAA